MNTKVLPRGIRNNNPGNIDRTAEKWQGMAEDQSGDSRFIVFKEAKWGIRAIAKLLMTYQAKYNLRTTEQIINRWAPPVENNTRAYIDAVAAKLRVRRTDPIDASRYAVSYVLVTAIIEHENGQQPYPKSTIDEGLALAGISQ